MNSLAIVLLGVTLAPLCDVVSAQQPVKIVGNDYVFTAPDTIQAGVTVFEFHNTGKETHEAILKRIPAGHTLREVFADTIGIPAWVVPAGGPNVIDPGVTARVTQTLEPGTYFWICVIAAPDGMSHSRKGMIRGMIVAPRATTTRARAKTPAAVEPVGKSVLNLRDFTFDFAKAPVRGAQWIRVNNPAEHPHEVVMFKLAPGKTMADALAWRPKDGPPPFTRIGGLATIPAGEHAFIRFAGERGRYMIRCRIPDAATGKTHRQLGMEMEFAIE